jgi:hypothetical protein
MSRYADDMNVAGVSLGPFPDYRSSMGRLMGSAAELWEFADPQSEVSKRLEAAIKACLSYGARITFIGSMDDQLVPLEVCPAELVLLPGLTC